MTTFEVKKTSELTAEEKSQIISLFNEIFRRKRDEKEFNDIYYNNIKGDSIHSLMKVDGVIVGHDAGIPCYYAIRGSKVLAMCNIDTMIHPMYRGIENYHDLMKAAFDEYKENGYDIVYGFPNIHAFPLVTGLRIMRLVGNLDTFCLPFRIGGIKKRMGIFNWASLFFCYCWLFFSKLIASGKVYRFLIEKDEESFNETRYLRNGGNYSVIHLQNLDFVYKVEDYDGVRAAFIIDVTQKSARNFCKAASYIWKRERKNCDMIVYVGVLPFRHSGLIKVPHRFEPKKFYFTAVLYSDILQMKDFYNLGNWDMNLSNYDLI